MKQIFDKVDCEVSSITRISGCLTGTGIIHRRDLDNYDNDDYFTFTYVPSTGYCGIVVSDFWKDTKEEIKDAIVKILTDNNCFSK